MIVAFLIVILFEPSCIEKSEKGADILFPIVFWDPPLSVPSLASRLTRPGTSSGRTSFLVSITFILSWTAVVMIRMMETEKILVLEISK